MVPGTLLHSDREYTAPAYAKAGKTMIMQVKDVMTRNVISVEPKESIIKAARLILLNRISGLPASM